jgi:hypothetical protein
VKGLDQEMQMVESPSEEIILSALINRIKTDEPLTTKLARRSTVCTLCQFMSRVEVHIRQEEVNKVRPLRCAR